MHTECLCVHYSLYVYIYLSGAILSGEDEIDVPKHAKSDEMTLQNTIDELLKCSAGRYTTVSESIRVL